MATPRDVINRALKLIGVLAQGETGTAAQLSDGLTTLNEMLESWSTENLMIHGETTENFDLVANQQTYSMGPAGDFATVRPIEILNLTWRDNTVSPVLELPIEIIPQEQWKYEEVKETNSIYPTKAYINYTYPNLTVNFWPMPSSARQVSITSNKQLTTYSSLSTAMSLPLGYLKAFRYNLAEELAPEYGMMPSNDVAKHARISKANVKRQNIKLTRLKSEVSGLVGRRGSFDYRTGE